jgi:spore coat polysaccharide biosynthesis protein SpsF
MGSARLPGKVLMDLAGEPMLSRVVHRTARATTLTSIVVATTKLDSEQPIVDLCHENGWECFRGSELDLLDRYHQASIEYQADVIVRITSDCPLMDPEVVDLVVGDFLNYGSLDYISNSRVPPASFPVGMDVEVMNASTLERAWKEDDDSSFREHVTPYIYRHPELFNLRTVVNDVDYSSFRWTIDTPEDLEFIRRIYGHFGHDRFSWREVVELVGKNSSWMDINQDVQQKSV